MTPLQKLQAENKKLRQALQDIADYPLLTFGDGFDEMVEFRLADQMRTMAKKALEP